MAGDFEILYIKAVDNLDAEYGGDDVYLGSELIGFRPYDGSDSLEIANEVRRELAAMLRERLGWKTAPVEEEQ